MHNLITLVNDNHVDNYLKEILEFVYYSSIVNNRLKNQHLLWVLNNSNSSSLYTFHAIWWLKEKVYTSIKSRAQSFKTNDVVS